MHSGLSLFLVDYLKNMSRGDHRLANAIALEELQELDRELLVRRDPARDASHEERKHHEFSYTTAIGGDLAGSLKDLADTM